MRLLYPITHLIDLRVAALRRMQCVSTGVFIVPTLPRGNASGDAPASRFASVGMHRLGDRFASGVGRRSVRGFPFPRWSVGTMARITGVGKGL